MCCHTPTAWNGSVGQLALDFGCLNKDKKRPGGAFLLPSGWLPFSAAGIFQGVRDIGLSFARARHRARRALVPVAQEVKGPARSLPDSTHSSSVCSHFLRM